jgi:hypothetical protein
MIKNNKLNYPCVENALHRLCPGVSWSVEYGATDDEYQIIWPSDVVDPPSDEAISAEIAALAAAWADREYITQRVLDYPPLADFADAFYWQQQGDDTKMTAYLKRIEAVKQRHPKPEPDAVVEITPTPEYVHRDQPPQEGEEPIV